MTTPDLLFVHDPSEREETVARALCVAFGVDPDRKLGATSQGPAGPAWRRWLVQARIQCASFDACFSIELAATKASVLKKRAR